MQTIRNRGLVVAVLLLAACDGTEPALDAGTDAGDANTRDPSLQIAWTDCSLRTEGDDMLAECAMVSVPLDWADPEGERIALFLKRTRGTPGGGQTWFLTGGPGQSGSDLEPLVEQLIGAAPDRTFYLLDHRGVGRSTRLRCPSTEGLDSPNGIGLGEGEIEACLGEVRAQWSDAQLAGFSTTQAAHDLGQLIDTLRVEDEVVTMWGGSYGTHWLERYLGHYPEQPDSVVFSAIALDVDLMRVDHHVDQVTRRWLDACDADPACGARFEAAFAATAREVAVRTFGGAEAELCPAMQDLDLSVEVLKPFFGQIFNDLQGRSFYLPMVYRLARCAPEDVDAMGHLVAALSPPSGMPALPLGVRQWGFVLSENIAVNELTQPRTEAEVQADFDAAIAVQGATPRLFESRSIWPRYTAPPFANSDYQGAALLLHGEYDFLPESAYRRTVDHHLASNPRADFVLLPGAPHSLESPTTEGINCGAELIVSRLLDPEAELDDCAARVVPLRFAPAEAVSGALFGTGDPWDGIPVAPPARPPTRRRGRTSVHLRRMAEGAAGPTWFSDRVAERLREAGEGDE